MLERPRFTLFRRYFFPYSGEEELTRAQGRRVIVSWALFFATVLTIATVPALLLIGPPPAQTVVLVLLLTFLGSLIIFGLMAWFVVYILNRSARIRQRWKE